MESVSHIDLNFQKPSMQPAIYAKQDDMLSRKIKARLFDGQNAWVPPTGSFAIVRCFKPDGNVCFYDKTEDGQDAILISNVTNEITIMLARQALAAPGDVKMEINFYTEATGSNDTDIGHKLTTFSVIIRVEKSVASDQEMMSDSYISILTDEITEIRTMAQEIGALTIAAEAISEYSSETPSATAVKTGTGLDYTFRFGLPKGPKGDMAVVTNQTYRYARTSTFTKPAKTSSDWQSEPPTPLSGTYSWTERTDTYNEDETKTVTTYFCVRNGLDGTGTVSTVAGTAVAEGTTNVPTAELLANLKAGLVDMLYPVGSIYMTKSSVSPATTFGGTWVEIESRFLVGAGNLYAVTQDITFQNNKVYYYYTGVQYKTFSGTVGNTIASAGTTIYEKLSLTAEETGGDFRHRLTWTEMPQHYHAHNFVLGFDGSSTNYEGFQSLNWGHINTSNANYGATDTRFQYTGSAGGIEYGDNASFSILPPYVVVHIWERTA